jgi:hypothetical protein
VWVFGAICRRSKRVALKTVRKRSAESLPAFVKTNIAPGTTIVTDMWRGYNNLKNNNFEHLKVNLSIYFVDPVNKEIHTNAI